MNQLKQSALACDDVLEGYKDDMDMDHILVYNSKLEVFVKNYLRLIKKAYESEYMLKYWGKKMSGNMLEIYAFINEHTENFEDALILNYEDAKRLIFNLSFTVGTPITLNSLPGNFIKFYRQFRIIYKYELY